MQPPCPSSSCACSKRGAFTPCCLQEKFMSKQEQPAAKVTRVGQASKPSPAPGLRKGFLSEAPQGRPATVKEAAPAAAPSSSTPSEAAAAAEAGTAESIAPDIEGILGAVQERPSRRPQSPNPAPSAPSPQGAASSSAADDLPVFERQGPSSSQPATVPFPDATHRKQSKVRGNDPRPDSMRPSLIGYMGGQVLAEVPEEISPLMHKALPASLQP
jgi:hypothetical protein